MFDEVSVLIIEASSPYMGTKGSATTTDTSSSIYGLDPYMGIKGSPTITDASSFIY